MQQKHFTSHPDQTRHAQSRIKLLETSNHIVNDQKRKSSCMHVLCDGLVLFRLRSKELSPVCTGTAFLFVDCHRSDNQFQENLNTKRQKKT